MKTHFVLYSCTGYELHFRRLEAFHAQVARANDSLREQVGRLLRLVDDKWGESRHD